ncbi:MAG: hypothetical protein VW418_02945 [Gammaproteobacteria bacterium]|jgi:hypothetical protein
MLNIFILVVSCVALLYCFFQLIQAKRRGILLQTLRDFMIVFLAVVMTAAIFYVGFRVLRGII